MLIVQAGRDLQIAAVDFDALRAAPSDVQTLEFPEANHTLKTSPAERAKAPDPPSKNKRA